MLDNRISCSPTTSIWRLYIARVIWLFFPLRSPLLVPGHHLHRLATLLQPILRRGIQPGLLSRSLPLRRDDYWWYAPRHHSHLRGPPLRIGNSPRIGITTNWPHCFPVAPYFILWNIFEPAINIGFDILPDGVRPLSDGWNSIPRFLRHLPQSARKLECGSITRGNKYWNPK